MSSIKEQALALASQGWYVMPVLPKSKEPHFDFIKTAHLSATLDTELISFWLEHDPQANIGISCAMSGLVVFDIDYRNGGKRLPEMTDTYTVETGNGLHLYYRATPEMRFWGKLGEGIDIKHRGYVVAAPSIHPSGAQYRVINDVEPATLPAGLAAIALKTRVAA